MKTFNEYYTKALEKHKNWLYRQKEEWWKKNSDKNLNIKGNYPEDVKFLSNEEKNDSPLFDNHTNVKNSEWGILFDMLAQGLIDWCCENVDWKNIDYFGFEIQKNTIETPHIIDYSFSVENYDFDKKITVKETNEKQLEKFKECMKFLNKITEEFFNKNEKNIPINWNYFSFGFDSLFVSCKFNKWVPDSDGFLNLGDYNNVTGDYDKYVTCM